MSIEDNMFKLRVRDTGVGIPSTELSKIFNKFHRASNVGRSIEGAGVGLALTHELIKLHKGGSISVDSVVERGR
jgi:signal transduction histidine kinase